MEYTGRSRRLLMTDEEADQWDAELSERRRLRLLQDEHAGMVLAMRPSPAQFELIDRALVRRAPRDTA